MTLEDETGNANVVVWRDVAERFRLPLHASRLMVVTGKLEHPEQETLLIAADIKDFRGSLGDLRVAARKFH